MKSLRELYFRMNNTIEMYDLTEGEGVTTEDLIKALELYKTTLGKLIGVE